MRAENKASSGRGPSLSDAFEGALQALKGVAPYVRAARAFWGVTQKELADQAGVGVATVSRIESGQAIWRRDGKALAAILRLLEDEGVECLPPSLTAGLRGGIRFWTPASDAVRDATLGRLATGACMKFPSELEQVWTSLDLSLAKSILRADEG